MRTGGTWLGLALAAAISLSAAAVRAQPAEPYPPDDPYGPPAGPDQPGPAEPAPPPDAPPPAPPAPSPYPPPPPYAQPPPPQDVGFRRDGWFIGFSIGAGSLTVHQDGTDSDSYGGPLFGFRFGGMVTPKLGLGLELAGGAHTVDQDAQIGIVQTHIALMARYWVMSQLWLGGSIGAASYGVRQDGNKLGDDLDGTVGTLAVGYEVWQGRRFALDLSLQMSAARFDPDGADLGTTSGGLAVGFNWY